MARIVGTFVRASRTLVSARRRQTFALSLVFLFPLLLMAQKFTVLHEFSGGADGQMPPPATLHAHATVDSSRPGVRVATGRGSTHPPFCQPKSCLYYAGDYETSYSDGNGLFNSNSINRSLLGQVWVGVKPDRDVTVTGATFVEFDPVGFVGINPTPFAVQVGIKPGQAGETVCSTSGNATFAAYGNWGDFPTSSFTIKKLRKPCTLKKGNVYYINLLPTSDDDYGNVWNVPPMAQNHHGWKNDLNDCYFNSAAYNANYVTCNSQGAFSELDIGLTGH